MKRLILALALVACAVPLHAHAGPRCHKLGQRFAAKRAAAPARVVMPTVGTATVQPVRGVFRVLAAPFKATCVNGNCGK